MTVSPRTVKFPIYHSSTSQEYSRTRPLVLSSSVSTHPSPTLLTHRDLAKESSSGDPPIVNTCLSAGEGSICARTNPPCSTASNAHLLSMDWPRERWGHHKRLVKKQKQSKRWLWQIRLAADSRNRLARFIRNRDYVHLIGYG